MACSFEKSGNQVTGLYSDAYNLAIDRAAGRAVRTVKKLTLNDYAAAAAAAAADDDDDDDGNQVILRRTVLQ